MASGYHSKTKVIDISLWSGSALKTGSIPEITFIQSPRYLTSTDWVDRGGAVPNFRRAIAKCQNATTTLSGVRRVVTDKPGYWRRVALTTSTNQYARHERYGSLSDPNTRVSLLPFQSLLVADNQAKMKFVNNAQQAQTSIQTGVVLGELRETLHMLRHPAQALRRGIDDYFNALKKRRRGSQSHRRRVVAETWLEHSFGWKPFISDIASAGKLLNRMIDYPSHIPVRGVGRSEDADDSYYSSNMFSAGEVRYHKLQKAESIVVYRGAVWLDTTDKLRFLGTQAGLTLNNFVPTVWELIPYSFLVDYFTNVGDVLTSWSFGRSNVAWSNKTTIEITKCTLIGSGYSFIIPSSQQAIVKECDPGYHETESRRVSRTSYTGNFVPDFRLEVPGMSSLKWLNLAALGATRRSFHPF